MNFVYERDSKEPENKTENTKYLKTNFHTLIFVSIWMSTIIRPGTYAAWHIENDDKKINK